MMKSPYARLADGVVLLHFAFVLFVALGGFLVLRWRRLAWAHVPAALWGIVIEYAGWVCPLTPLENLLRERAGGGGYARGFVDHYVTGWLYPAGLTRTTQVVLGSLVLILNLVIYWRLVRPHLKTGRRSAP